MATFKTSVIGSVQGRKLIGLEARGHALRMNPGRKEDLVGVDVADARENLLVHDCRFDPAVRAAKPLGQAISAISRASGPWDRAKASPAASGPANQWILPSAPLQYQIVASGLANRNDRRTCSGRGGFMSQKPPVIRAG